MIYTITFNPSLDYIVNVDNFACGTVNRTKKEQIFPGGKGINVSIVLQNLGVASTALGFLAGFTGDRVQQLLEEKGIVTDFIRVKEGNSRINVKLRSDCSDGAGGGMKCEETEINGLGPALGTDEIRVLYEKLEQLKAGDILIMAGSIPSSLPSTMYMDIMQSLQGRDIRMIVDATGDLLKKVLVFQPFLIKPNHHELGELFETDLHDKEEVIICAKRLQELGAQNVLVSMAGDGAVLITQTGDVYQMEAPEGKVKNSVGAGDSMVAGFVAGYLKSGSFLEAFQLGVCAGSASAFSEELATRDEILALYEKIDI